MGRYRRKVFEAEAVQYDPAESDVFFRFLAEHNLNDRPQPWKIDGANELWIWVEKHSAWEHLPANGWAIAETDIGVYPCTAEEFEARYEPAPTEG